MPLSAWEPAAGEGHMAEVLMEYFQQVRASDVFDYGCGWQPTNFDHRAVLVPLLRLVRDALAEEHVGGLLRFRGMPTPYRQQAAAWTGLPVPAAPVLTDDGLCSECRARPQLICKGEVKICSSCLAVLWHSNRRAAATPKHRPPLHPH
jgi:hypothetical protein